MYELEVVDECFDEDYIVYSFGNWDDFYELLYNCYKLSLDVVCDYVVIHFDLSYKVCD